MIPRGRNEYLTQEEREDLHRRLRRNENRADLCELFRLHPRTIDIHRRKMKGDYTRANVEAAAPDRDAAHQAVDKVCWVSGCGTVVPDGQPFCNAHCYKAPTVNEKLLRRMMAGR